MVSEDEAMAKVREDLEGKGFVQALADRVGAAATAGAVFGQPVEREGVTVIPVARAIWGFGGGSGGEPTQQGSGGGGGGLVTPVGCIEVRESGAEFKPIRDPRLLAAGVGLAVGFAGLALRARGRR
jgi:uncharacterized spore protein YtfJ